MDYLSLWAADESRRTMGTPFLRHVSFGSGWPRGGWQCSVVGSPTTERVTSGARRKSGCKSVGPYQRFAQSKHRVQKNKLTVNILVLLTTFIDYACAIDFGWAISWNERKTKWICTIYENWLSVGQSSRLSLLN